MTELAGVLLAAGGSARLGQSKQLLRWQGEALVRRQARALLALCNPVVVVTGAQAAAVEAELDGLAVEIARNAQWPAGMGASLALGAARQAGATGLLVLLADQWRITAADLAVLVAAWREAPEQAVAAQWPGCAAGVPAVFPACALAGLKSLRGDVGARRLLSSGQFPLRTMPMPNAAFDLDTPQDLEVLLAQGEPNR